MKAQWDGGGRITLGDYTGGGVVVLWLIGSSALEFEFQLDSLLYTHIWLCIYWIATYTKLDLHWTFQNVTAAYLFYNVLCT